MLRFTVLNALVLLSEAYSKTPAATMAVIDNSNNGPKTDSVKSNSTIPLYFDPEELYPKDCVDRTFFNTVYSDLDALRNITSSSFSSPENKPTNDTSAGAAARADLKARSTTKNSSKSSDTPAKRRLLSRSEGETQKNTSGDEKSANSTSTEQHELTGVKCTEVMRKYPYFPISDSNNPTRQVELCEALCTTELECLAYSLSWKMSKDSKMIARSVSCELCRVSHDEEKMDKGFVSTPVKDGSFVHTAYKMKDVFVNQVRQQLPCKVDDECGIEMTGMSNGELCAGVRDSEDPDSLIVEFTTGDQNAGNEIYQTLCELYFIATVTQKNRYDLTCVNAKQTEKGVQCEFIRAKDDGSLLKGSQAISSSTLARPICKVPSRHAVPEDFNVSNRVDCRDRQKIYSRVSKTGVKFDCSTVLSPAYPETAKACAEVSLIDDVANTYCCDTPLWHTHWVQNKRENSVDYAYEDFKYETIRDWCPNVCNPGCIALTVHQFEEPQIEQKPEMPDSGASVAEAMRSRSKEEGLYTPASTYQAASPANATAASAEVTADGQVKA